MQQTLYWLLLCPLRSPASKRKIKLSIVVGKIVVGIIIVHNGFGWVGHHEEILNLLTELGFVFLIFLSRMEIDFSILALSKDEGEKSKDQPWNLLQIAGGFYILTRVLSCLIRFGLVCTELVNNPWLIALILSTNVLEVIVPVLKEQGLSRRRYGQTLLISGLIGDFVTMLLITVAMAAISQRLTLDILLISLLFVAFFTFYYFSKKLFNKFSGVRWVLEE